MADSEAPSDDLETERIVVTRRMSSDGGMFNQFFWSEGLSKDPTLALGMLEAAKIRFQQLLAENSEDID